MDKAVDARKNGDSTVARLRLANDTRSKYLLTLDIEV